MTFYVILPGKSVIASPRSGGVIEMYGNVLPKLNQDMTCKSELWDVWDYQDDEDNICPLLLSSTKCTCLSPVSYKPGHWATDYHHWLYGYTLI